MTARRASARENALFVRAAAAALAWLALLSAASILAPQIGYGPGLGSDPANYLCTARNLLAGEGFFGCGGSAFSPWAPGWPILLAAGGLLDIDPYDVAGPLNAAAFGALVFVSGRWLLRNLESRLLAVLGCLAVASSLPLTRIASYAYSDTVFLLLATLALTGADRYFSDGGRRRLAWAAAFAALACATRYSGVVIVVVVTAGLIMERRGSPRRKAERAWAYALASAAPVCVWMLRNLLVEGWFFARRQPVDHPLPEILADIARKVGAWASHADDARADLGALGAAALLCLAAAVGRCAARAYPRTPRRGERQFLLFGGFSVAFVVFYAYTATAGHTWHGVQARHLLPLCVPLLFAALLGADRAAGAGARVLAAGLLLWLSWGAYPSIRDVLRGGLSAYSPYGYAPPEHADSEAARRSEVVRYLRVDAGRGGVVWSNARDWLKIHAGAMAAHSPLPEGGSDAAGALAEWFESRVRGGDRIVWLRGDRHRGERGYDVDDLRALPGAILLADLKDGLVFRKNTFSEIARPGASLATRYSFDVRIDADGKRLLLIDRACRRMDPGAGFTLHLTPVRVSDLPPNRRVWRFDNLDSEFQRNRRDDEGECRTFAKLPDYEIASAHFGQPAGRAAAAWKVTIP